MPGLAVKIAEMPAHGATNQLLRDRSDIKITPVFHRIPHNLHMGRWRQALNFTAQPLMSLLITLARGATSRSRKSSPSQSSENILRCPIPRILMGCNPPGASKRAYLRTQHYRRKIESLSTHFLTSVVPPLHCFVVTSLPCQFQSTPPHGGRLQRSKARVLKAIRGEFCEPLKFSPPFF